MDQLLKQLGGGAAGGFAGFLGGGQEGNSQGEEEMLDDEQLMENLKVTYDIFIQNVLSATSHTVQWLPYQTQDPDYPAFTREYFLLGTHTDEEVMQDDTQECVYIASVRVPICNKAQKSVIDYSRLSKDYSAVQIVKRFPHECEVNKARAMKQDWKMFASIANTGEVLMYHYDEANPQQDNPIMRLQGLDQEGFGLSWNPQQKGLLIASTGLQICLWDINESKNGEASVKLEKAHENTINDVKFSNVNQYLFGTASDDNNYKLWDIRSLKGANSFIHCNKASEDDLLVLSFNHKNEYLFATGGEQSGIINVWDMRMPKYFINDLLYHKSQVNQIEWSPFSENLFMTSSGDGKIFIWDHNKTGEEQARHDYEDGPPEMIFPHEAHRQSNIEDIAWSVNNENVVVSCDTDLKMQIWKMSDDFFFNEADYIDQLDDINEMEIE